MSRLELMFDLFVFRGMGATLPLELNILTAFSSTYLVEEIKPKTELVSQGEQFIWKIKVGN